MRLAFSCIMLLALLLFSSARAENKKFEAESGSRHELSFDIPASPITADATPAAKALYSFLRENFGKRTVSGIMTGSMDGTSGTDIKKGCAERKKKTS